MLTLIFDNVKVCNIRTLALSSRVSLTTFALALAYLHLIQLPCMILNWWTVSTIPIPEPIGDKQPGPFFLLLIKSRPICKKFFFPVFEGLVGGFELENDVLVGVGGDSGRPGDDPHFDNEFAFFITFFIADFLELNVGAMYDVREFEMNEESISLHSESSEKEWSDFGREYDLRRSAFSSTDNLPGIISASQSRKQLRDDCFHITFFVKECNLSKKLEFE